MKKTMIAIILAASWIVSVAPSESRWVYKRSDGVEVMTDRYDNIPPEYRGVAKEIGGRGDEDFDLQQWRQQRKDLRENPER